MVSIPVTDEITLTRLEESDLEELVRQINDPVIHANTLTVPHPYTFEHAKAFLEHVLAFENQHQFQKDWTIRKNGRLVGGIGALMNYGVDSHKSEIGYWLGAESRGRGLMAPIIRAFVHHLFAQTALRRLEAHVFVGNQASAKALERGGFILEGTTRGVLVKDGVLRDTLQYALIKDSEMSY